MFLLHEKANLLSGFCQVYPRGTIEGGFFDWRDLRTSCILPVNHEFLVPSPIGEIMIDAIVAWDAEDDPGGNVQHIIEHGITMEEVEEVLLNENNPVGESRSSGRPLTFGKTSTGRYITV